MNFNAGGVQNAEGVATVLQSDIDDAVDPHLERIRNGNGEESDEEVQFLFHFSCISEFVVLICRYLQNATTNAIKCCANLFIT